MVNTYSSRVVLFIAITVALVGSGCTDVARTRIMANQGDPQAQFKLGSMYAVGQGVYQDADEAARWFRLASVDGNPDILFKIGTMYATGKGIPRNYVTASRFYRSAADQDHSDAQTELGMLYVQGLGVPQDYTEALQLFLKAAKLGNGRARLKIGEMYAEGRGVPRDVVRAHMWSNLAGAQGDRQALTFRDTLAAKMTNEQIYKAQELAREWEVRN
ncbi:MAG TPA: tetratricopeptide repeat protein [Nitrospiraceae bacterium]|nr:tetratricopeptide repeat protein [Nitrospiraceae bacterium]